MDCVLRNISVPPRTRFHITGQLRERGLHCGAFISSCSPFLSMCLCFACLVFISVFVTFLFFSFLTPKSKSVKRFVGRILGSLGVSSFMKYELIRFWPANAFIFDEHNLGIRVDAVLTHSGTSREQIIGAWSEPTISSHMSAIVTTGTEELWSSQASRVKLMLLEHKI